MQIFRYHNWPTGGCLFGEQSSDSVLADFINNVFELDINIRAITPETHGLVKDL